MMHRPQASHIHTLSKHLSGLRDTLAVMQGKAAAAIARQIRKIDDRLTRLWRQEARFNSWNKRHSAYYRAGLNGKQACARRARQIAEGRLRPENGLVLPTANGEPSP